MTTVWLKVKEMVKRSKGTNSEVLVFKALIFAQ